MRPATLHKSGDHQQNQKSFRILMKFSKTRIGMNPKTALTNASWQLCSKGICVCQRINVLSSGFWNLSSSFVDLGFFCFCVAECRLPQVFSTFNLLCPSQVCQLTTVTCWLRHRQLHSLSVGLNFTVFHVWPIGRHLATS